MGEDVSSGSIECIKVATDSSVMIAPPSFDMNGSINLSDALSCPFIWRETGSATRKTFESAALKRGFEKDEFEVAALIDDMDAKMMILDKAYADVEPGGYTSKLFTMDERYFYKPLYTKEEK